MSCTNCFTGGIRTASPTGREEIISGKTCYIADPPPAASTRSNQAGDPSTIINITDAFGLKLVNNKLLADIYAQHTGCRVIVPDIVPGGPASLSLIDSLHRFSQPVAWHDILGLMRKLIAGVGVLWVLVPFLRRAAPPKSYPVVHDFVRAVRKDLAPGTKLGVAGFCWGGYHSTKLCSETCDGQPLIDAQFCAHPSGLNLPQMIVDAVSTTIPYSMAIGDRDVVVPKPQVTNLEAALRTAVGEASLVNRYEIVSYNGCTHGFAVRAHADDKHEIRCSEMAQQQAADWFRKYL